MRATRSVNKIRKKCSSRDYVLKGEKELQFKVQTTGCIPLLWGFGRIRTRIHMDYRVVQKYSCQLELCTILSCLGGQHVDALPFCQLRKNSHAIQGTEQDFFNLTLCTYLSVELEGIPYLELRKVQIRWIYRNFCRNGEPRCPMSFPNKK